MKNDANKSSNAAKQLRLDTSPKPVLRRLLPSLAIMLILLMAGTGALLWQQHQQRLIGEIALEIADVSGDLRTALDQQASGLAAAVQLVAADATVQTALCAGAADRLLAAWQPVFGTLNRDNHITHFYFFDTNRVCLLRVHKPEMRGDRIERFTALEAERTGKTASGIELGPLGTFTLRVVQPVFAGGTLAGYVEFGKEIEDVLQTLHTWSGVQLTVVIRKEYLNRQSWEDGMRLLGRHSGWDRLPHSVVIYADQGRLPDAFVSWADQVTGECVHGKTNRYIISDGKNWLAAAAPLQDASGKEVGKLLAMRDISTAKAAFARQLAMGITSGTVLLALLIGIIYVLLRRTDAGIRAQQAALRESEERYRRLFEGSRDAIMTLEPPSWKFTSGNPAAIEMFKAKNEAEFVSCEPWKLSPERQADARASDEKAKEMIAQAMREGTHFFEWTHKRIGGGEFFATVLLSRIEQDNILFLQATVRDITRQKRSEEMLLFKTMLLEAQSEASLDGILAVDNEGHVILFNKRFGELWQIPQHVLDTKDDAKLLEYVSKQLKDPAEFNRKVAYLYEHKDEKSRDEIDFTDGSCFDRYSSPLISADGKYHGRIWYFRDITKRKQAEKAIMRSEKQYRQLVDTLQEGIWLIDKDANTTFVNPRMAELLGYSIAGMLGKSLFDFMDERGVALAKIYIERRKESVTEQHDFEFIHKNGNRVYTTLATSPVTDEQGNYIGALAGVNDITARKQVENEVRKLNETLEQRVKERTAELARTNQELEMLIRIASHDLRSPLVNIQGFCQLLNKSCNAISRILADAVLPDETRQALVAPHEKAVKSMLFINASVEKMNGLISGLLRLSQLGRAPLVLQTLDMNALLQTVLEAMAFQIREAAAEVTADVLPPCQSDAALISQVFSNLLDNAIKYRDRVRPLRIRVWGRHENTRAVYCVEDNGLGVAPEYHQKIWNLFYRLSPPGNGAGDGIGLPAVQRIVERHGGTVWLESESGKGSRFFLALPAAGKETAS